MKETPKGSDAVWSRLRANRQDNAHLFHAAGFRPELAREVECPACGAQESALFWTVTRAEAATLHLLCPFCEEATARYAFAGDRPSRRGAIAAVGVAAILGALGVFLLVRESPLTGRAAPPVQVRALEAYDAGAALAGAALRAASVLVPGLDENTWQPPRSAAPRAATPRPDRPAPVAGRPTSTTAPQPTRRVSAAGSAGAASTPPPARTPSAVDPGGGATASQSAAPAARVFVARGDRRQALDLDAAAIIQRSGERESRLLLEIVYDPERDETRVVVDPASADWPRRLNRLRGWRQAPQ